MFNNKTVFEYEPLPTEENIKFVFQKLIFDLVCGANFETYLGSKREIENILSIVTEWLAKFINTKSLSHIKYDDLLSLNERIYQLDDKYLSADGLYMEDAYEWIVQLQVIYEMVIEKTNAQ